MWDLVAGKELQCFRGHRRSIHTVAISPDGNLVASGSLDATAKVWNVQTGELIADFDSHPQMVNVVAFHPDGTRVWTGCCDHLLRLWDIEREEVVAKFEHRDCVQSVDTLGDGSRRVDWPAGWDRCPLGD